jgi:signal transduction histidine kinase/ligand-binding sensor domain-containing protein
VSKRTTTDSSIPRLLEICVLLACLQSSLSSQVAVDRWTTDSGLPINSIRTICQTPDGYLWLATLDGMVRFDGVRFVSFDHGNTEGVGGNRFSWLLCTRDGDLWAATEGSGVTRYHAGHFKTYTVKDGLASDVALGITGDNEGNIWVLAFGQVSQWNASKQRFEPLPGKTEYSGVLNGGAVFWGLDESGVHLFSRGKAGDFTLPGGWPRALPSMGGVDLNTRIWLATRTGKLAQLVDGRWIGVAGGGNRRSTHNGKISFTTQYRDTRGKIWQIENSWDGSIFVQNLILPPGTEPAKIAFSSFFEDRDGNVWVGTDGQGLYRLRSQTIQVLSKEQGLPDRNIYPIFQSKNGTVWIGTWTGGLVSLSAGKVTKYTTKDGLASNRVNAIGEDSDNTLWVADEWSLHRMKNGRFGSFTCNGLISGKVVRAIHVDRAGTLWFGSDEGLIRLDQGKCSLLTRKGGLAVEDIRVIIDSRDGGLWVAGYGGLSRLRDGEIRAWTTDNGLPSNAIRALHEDADGVLWIGTYDGGLGRFANGRFTKYTVREGLFNNGVFQILEDARGNLWISCNRGIYRLRKQELNDFADGKVSRISSVSYGRHDGMRNIECNGGLWPAGIKTTDGRMWFPTQDGVAVIDPETVLGDRPAPPVAIESLRVNQRTEALDHPVRVAPGHENFEIQYSALSFVNSERIRFKYRMEGLDQDWVDAGVRRTAYYSHIPPGSYHFLVAAAHDDGGWNGRWSSLAITVLPRFYQTWWFLIVSLTAGCVMLALGVRHRLLLEARERAEQRAFSQQLITSQENERKRIAGELHDSLGQRLIVIKNLALLLLQNRHPSSLNGAQRDQIQEISSEASGAVREVREISYNLRPYQLDRLGLTAALQAMIQTASASSATMFRIEIDDVDGALRHDAEINFYRIVQECVNNVLKHSRAAEAVIQVQRNHETLVLTVHDDGAGFAPESVHSNHHRGGFGLTGISERARLLGGSAHFRSVPGRGATVKVEINAGGLQSE